MKDQRLKTKEIGLTLIELLVVIGVIAVLLSLAAFTFITVQTRSRDGERKSDLSKIQVALEQYFSDQKFYTTDIYDGSLNSYLNPVPADPRGGYFNYSPTPAGCDNGATNCTGYTLWACLENTGDSDRDAEDGDTAAPGVDSCGSGTPDGRVSYTVTSGP